MADGDVVTEGAGREVVLGDIGTSIVFENEHVRVWEVLLEPGQLQPWHHHQHPYLVIALEEAHNLMQFLDGSEPRRMHETAGRVVYREPGKPHNLRNVGETRYRSRLIELKDLR